MSKGFFFNFFDDELPDRVRYSWSTTPVPIDMNCTHGVQWMWLVFQQCAVSPAEITAVVMGLISVFSWMLNGIPQIIENYKTGIPDQAVSLFLLIFWTIGDSFSLAGCLLTHQLVLQVVMAFYSIVNDTILLGQYFFYRMRHKRLLRVFPNDIETLLPSDSASDSEPPSSNHSQPVRTGSAASLLSITALLCVGLPCVNRTETPLATDPSLKNGPLFALSVHSTTLSPESPFYPWRRGSTEGLSIFLFMFALLGNASYGLQIFLTSTDTLFLLHSLPWILGSLGVLFLDVVILAQFYVFRRRRQRNPTQTVEAESTAVSITI
uniref:Lysosomal amino acid transporter 1 n=1 Tax=Schistocephalus solidus TaxID=70667 RepID=A0A0X3PCL5_SCHSO